MDSTKKRWNITTVRIAPFRKGTRRSEIIYVPAKRKIEPHKKEPGSK